MVKRPYLSGGMPYSWFSREMLYLESASLWYSDGYGFKARAPAKDLSAAGCGAP